MLAMLREIRNQSKGAYAMGPIPAAIPTVSRHLKATKPRTAEKDMLEVNDLSVIHVPTWHTHVCAHATTSRDATKAVNDKPGSMMC